MKIYFLIGLILMSLTVQADTANKKIIILGAGIIGVTSAYYLAEQGYDVTVIERHADVAQESSYANGAQLCYSCIYPLYSNSIFSAFLFALKKLQLHSHILSNLAPMQSLQSYLIDKSLDKELSSYRNNLFKDSAIEFNKLIQKLHMSFPFEGSGVLQIFFSQTELDNAKNMAKYKAQNGITFSILSHEECIKLQPSLKFSNKKIQGGILMHHDGIGDAHLFTKELAKICQNIGVKFLYNTEVKKLMLENGTITGLITKQDKT
jgi:D-amino-acid dehydrogenase